MRFEETRRREHEERIRGPIEGLVLWAMGCGMAAEACGDETSYEAEVLEAAAAWAAAHGLK